VGQVVNLRRIVNPPADDMAKEKVDQYALEIKDRLPSGRRKTAYNTKAFSLKLTVHPDV